MFSQVKTAAAAALIAVTASPASAAIVDIYATATLTEVFRSGFFETGFDPSDYSFVYPEIAPGAFDAFKDARIGDTVSIHWKLDTEAGSDWDQDPEDKSEDVSYAYPGGPVSATFTVNGTNWHVGNSEGSSARYKDQPDDFSMNYSSGDNAEDTLGGYPSGAYHETTIDVRPDDYVTSKGLTNTFDYRGNNLGGGNLGITSEVITEDIEGNYKEVYSSLKLNYQVTALSTSPLQNVEIASMPLPPGVLLIASGLFGFGLLRRRKL